MVYEKVGLANFFQYIIIILFIIFLFYIMKSSPSPPPLQGIGALLRALPVEFRDVGKKCPGAIAKGSTAGRDEQGYRDMDLLRQASL